MKKIILLLLFTSIFILGQSQKYNVIDHELQEVMNHKSDETISINIILKSQIDLDKLNTNNKRFNDKSSKRESFVKEFKEFSEKTQSDVLSILQSEKRSSRVSDIKCHWITNMINCNATRDVIYQLSNHPDIALIGYNKKEYMLFNEVSSVAEPRADIIDNIKKVNADDVWNQGYTGKGVLVAVLDTGVNTDHIDLKDHLWDGGSEYPNHGYNTFDDNHDITDIDGHGTHCAGTICGDGTSGTKTGMAPDATLMCVKIMGDDGEGTLEAIVSGVEFAVEHDADVLSLSVGFSFPVMYVSNILRQVFTNTLELGVVASVAAGNDADKIYQYPIPRNVNSPGNCPPPWLHPDQQANPGGLSSVICVGAVDYDDVPAYFSSEGPVTWVGSDWDDYHYDMTADVEEGWLLYDNDYYDVAIGGVQSFRWGIMFPPSKLEGYENGDLTKVAMYDCAAYSGNIEIYQGGDTPNEGVLVHSQSYYCTGTLTWKEVELSTSVSIDTNQNLWIILQTDDGDKYPAACCTMNDDPNSRWISVNDEWYDMTELELNNSWMIRGFVDNYSGSVTASGNFRSNDEFGLIRPDISAPGVGIVSLDNDSNDGFISLSGTSMATPCVAGVMALMIEKNPYITPAQICEILETTAVKLTDTKNNKTGSGRIDALAAIEAMGSDETKPVIKFLSCSPIDIETGKNTELSVTLINEGDAPTKGVLNIKLSCNDEYITIIDDIATFSQIHPNETSTATFVVKANTSTPDNYVFDFSLTDAAETTSTESIKYTFENDMDGWTTIDANGDGHTWYHSSQASEHENRTDNGYIISESYCNASQTAIEPDDYVVSPFKVRVGDYTSIEFIAQAQDKNYPNERIGLAVSTSGNASASNFTTLCIWDLIAKEQGNWYKCSKDLSEYKGEEIWIAIRHYDCYDQFKVNIDDFSIFNYVTDNIWSESFSITVSNECNAPTNLKITSVSENSINLSWEKSSTANKYEVYRNESKLTTTLGNSYIDRNLEPNTEYCYTVKSICNIGTSEDSNEACATTHDLSVTAPENLDATAVSTSSISLKWNAVENALSYNIYRDNELLKNVAEPSFLDEGLQYNTEYCYYVTAVRNNTESEESESVCKKTLGENIEEINPSVSIHPNPVENEVLIKTESVIEEVSIYTLTGVLISQRTTDYGQQTLNIDVTRLNSGIYFIKIKTNDTETTKRFIKK